MQEFPTEPTVNQLQRCCKQMESNYLPTDIYEQNNSSTSNITWKKAKLLSEITVKVMKTLNKMKFKVNTTTKQALVFLPHGSIAKQMKKGTK